MTFEEKKALYKSKFISLDEALGDDPFRRLPSPRPPRL